MPKAVNYTDSEILLAMIWSMPKKMTNGQIGRLIGTKSAGQKHWRERLERLGKENLLSIETLDAGDLFSGSPILKYHLSEANLETIWQKYFISFDDGQGLVKDPFLAPFLAGCWNPTGNPEFSKVIGSKFNFCFLCAKNAANPVPASEIFSSLSRERTWKTIEATLSIGWKTEKFRRSADILKRLDQQQKKSFTALSSIYEEQIRSHPAEYRDFVSLFDKSFKYSI